MVQRVMGYTGTVGLYVWTYGMGTTVKDAKRSIFFGMYEKDPSVGLLGR